MDSLRAQVKIKLLQEGNGKVPLCPLCPERVGNPFAAHNPAVQLHEIVCPQMKGGKYHPLSPELAEVIYVVENCILLCWNCNVNYANSVPKERMLELRMEQGVSPERMVAAMQAIARQLKNPAAWIPRSITFKGVTYPCLDFVSV